MARKMGDILRLSIVLLLDTSGSMYGEKIQALNLAVANLLDGFKRQALAEEPHVAVITFGGNPLLQSFVPVSRMPAAEWGVGGTTCLTKALCMAREIVTPQTISILISDGSPDDGGFARVRLSGELFAISIGYDSRPEALSRFTGNPARVFSASEAESLPGYWLSHCFGEGRLCNL